jgi:hypothetical protein
MKIVRCILDRDDSSLVINAMFVKHNPFLDFQYRPPRRQHRRFVGMVRISAPVRRTRFAAVRNENEPRVAVGVL